MMSMLSAQCDELRIMANISELPDGVRLALRQAADTIWELRCKLNDEQDENTRLRSCLTDAAENARLIMGENAKLRELVRRMAHVLRADDEWRDPFYCNPYCADQFNCRSDDCVEVLCPIVEAMRELGVEVDE